MYIFLIEFFVCFCATEYNGDNRYTLMTFSHKTWIIYNIHDNVQEKIDFFSFHNFCVVLKSKRTWNERKKHKVVQGNRKDDRIWEKSLFDTKTSWLFINYCTLFVTRTTGLGCFIYNSFIIKNRTNRNVMWLKNTADFVHCQTKNSCFSLNFMMSDWNRLFIWCGVLARTREKRKGTYYKIPFKRAKK